MSNARVDSLVDPIVPECSNPPKIANKNGFFEKYKEACFTGAVVGPATSTLMFGFDKVSFYFQTHDPKEATYKRALISTWKNLSHGYGMTILNSVMKNIILFPIKEGVDSVMEQYNPGAAFNKQVGGFVAGLMSVYLTSPISVVKALRFNSTPMSDIFALNLRDLFRGVHATALRDGIQAGIFFGLRPVMSNYASEFRANQYVSVSILNLMIDMAGGLLGAIASTPCSVIAVNQKIKGGGMIEQAVSLYREGGVSRFYQGSKVAFFRMGFQACAVGGGIRVAEKMYKQRMAAE